jgi:hypothetical protein
VQEILSSELALPFKQTFKELVPEIITTGLRLMAWPDHQNVFTLTDDHERFNTFQLTPSAPEAGGAIFLETNLGLGHVSKPGMTPVNRNVMYGY